MKLRVRTQPTPDTQHRTPDTRPPTPDTRPPTPPNPPPTPAPPPPHPTPDTRHPTPDPRPPTPDTAHPTPDIQLPTPDTHPSPCVLACDTSKDFERKPRALSFVSVRRGLMLTSTICTIACPSFARTK